MPMHTQVGDHEFVKASLHTLVQNVQAADDQTKAAIAQCMGWTDESQLAVEHQNLLATLQKVSTTADAEVPMPYVHYASRFDLVGCYQAALSKLFSDIPQLQGYGDGNAIWAVTPVEQATHMVKTFFSRVFGGGSAQAPSQPLMISFLQAWKELPFANAPYPAGVPAVIPFPDECQVALLADWGGDNPAAKKVAQTVIKANPQIAIHLGDIYYGGTKEECGTFLANWPVRMDGNNLRPNANFALNGNHEMYTGGESYFEVVLPGFGQKQPFFCLENSNWRLIGVDTAYNGGRLMPGDADDPLNAQWNWLVSLLSLDDKKANILLSHHQPVSAHAQEFSDSEPLRKDIEALLATKGVRAGAIFGWFFGHEHRCAIYQPDPDTLYFPRLIGSGCIPHIVQAEIKSDEGCTPAQWFNKRAEGGNANSAVSMFVNLQFVRDQVVADYIDEDEMSWGSETWCSDPGRLMASTAFAPADGIELVGGE